MLPIAPHIFSCLDISSVSNSYIFVHKRIRKKYLEHSLVSMLLVKAQTYFTDLHRLLWNKLTVTFVEINSTLVRQCYLRIGPWTVAFSLGCCQKSIVFIYYLIPSLKNLSVYHTNLFSNLFSLITLKFHMINHTETVVSGIHLGT